MLAHRVRSIALGWMVVLGLAGLALAQPGSLPPSAPDLPIDSDLAYVAPDGRVAWLAAGETTPRLVGSRAARYAFPVFSPDGSKLAAIERTTEGARAVVFDLAATRDALPDRAIWFERGGAPVIYLDWRDDGTALFVLAGGSQGFTLEIASEERVIGPWAGGAPLYWDEGSEGLVVHVGGAEGARLLRLDAEGAVDEEIDGLGAFRSPAVSPSGRWLAYVERAGGSVQRTVIARQDQGPIDEAERRSLDVRGISAFAWHPRRDLLALTRPFDDVPHSFGPLGGLDAETGMFEPWTDVSVLAFWWSPDGETVAVLATPAPSGGSVAGSRSSATLASATGGSIGPAASVRVRSAGQPPVTPMATPVQAGPLRLRLGLVDPDGGEVAWLGTVTPQTLFLDQAVPFFDQYARSHAVWSADGRWLALPIVDTQGRDVVGLVDVRTGSLRELAPGTAPVFAPR